MDSNSGTILRNASPALLYEEAIEYEKGTAIADNGALIVRSGDRTGRRPRDKRIVEHSASKEHVSWGEVNIALDEKTFLINRQRASDCLDTCNRLYIVDGFAGWDPKYRIKIRVISSRAYMRFSCTTCSFRRADLTENTRACYPIDHIVNAKIPAIGGHLKNIIFLTADAFGVLPPVARLNSAQTMYHFISGYTAKIAGTEEGGVEQQATFSACFGAAFMVRHPSLYAKLLAGKIRTHDSRVWLVNTGWSGGPYGAGYHHRPCIRPESGDTVPGRAGRAFSHHVARGRTRRPLTRRRANWPSCSRQTLLNLKVPWGVEPADHGGRTPIVTRFETGCQQVSGGTLQADPRGGRHPAS